MKYHIGLQIQNQKAEKYWMFRFFFLSIMEQILPCTSQFLEFKANVLFLVNGENEKFL